MKILQVIDTFGVGGAERVALDLTELLREAGVTVEVLTLLEPGPLAAQFSPDIRVHCLRRRHRFDLRAAHGFVRLARDFDVIHVHMRHNYRYCRLFARLFGLRRPIVLHDHFGGLAPDSTAAFGFRLGLKPRWYIGVSAHLLHWAQNQWRIPEARTLFLGNIIRPIKTAPLPKKVEIVLVSNLKPLKNQSFALELCAKMDFPLSLVGKVQDEAYFQQLQAQVAKNGHAANVHFIQDCPEVQAILPGFQLGLHTSLKESGPLVLLEYLAQGLPFLAYATGAVAALIRTEFPEYFIDNFELDDWQKRITQLIHSQPDTDKMERVLKAHFSPQQYSEKCLKFYQKILENQAC